MSLCQNVLLQLGLRLISVSGLSISSTRQFLHKCHACFTLTRDMARVFCPACGLATLIKCTLVVTAEPSGAITARMFHGMRHMSKRGTRYSIPRPKGGRGGGGLRLAEDVMQGFGRRGKTGNQVDADALYEKGVEFGLGKSGQARKADVVGYGRKNPNEVAKRTGNRKKRH